MTVLFLIALPFIRAELRRNGMRLSRVKVVVWLVIAINTDFTIGFVYHTLSTIAK